MDERIKRLMEFLRFIAHVPLALVVILAIGCFSLVAGVTLVRVTAWLLAHLLAFS